LLIFCILWLEYPEIQEMRILCFYFLLNIINPVRAQDLFSLIKNNEYNEVKNYIGAVNLRDTNQATPLMWAIYKSDLRMVKLLVKKRADVRMKGWILFTDTVSKFEYLYGSCLAVASGENKVNILRYLIHTKKIPVDDREILLYDFKEEGWTALHWAAVKGNTAALRFLIRNGADVNSISTNDYNQTPLLFAINFNRINTAKILINKRADVNQKDLFGSSPLSSSLEIQNKELIRELIKHGAKMEQYIDIPIEEMLLELFGVKRIEDL
jgi:ankyrin repeat protein